MTTEATRDGSSLREIETGKEVKFIPNSKDGERRETAFELWLGKFDLERFYLADTREDGDA